jgi:hypothetical protein
LRERQSLYLEFVKDLAQKRHVMAIERQRKQKNNAPTDATKALLLHRLGALGEFIVNDFLRPVLWHCIIRWGV